MTQTAQTSDGPHPRPGRRARDGGATVARLASRGGRTLVGSVALLWCLGIPVEGRAQEFDRVEVQGGVGYVNMENWAPDGATWNVAGVVWWSERWGVAVSHIGGPQGYGNTYDTYQDMTSRQFAVRYRRYSRHDVEINLGFGVIDYRSRTADNGCTLEFFVGKKIMPHLGIKGGVTVNIRPFGDTPNFLHPQGFLFFSF